MRSYHVVHIIPTLGYGGAEQFVVSLCRTVPSEERMSIILFRDHAPLRAALPQDVTVHIVEKQSKFELGYHKRLQQVLADLQPDIVHTHLFGADVWGAKAAHALNIPVMSTEHGMNENEGILKTSVKKHMIKDNIDAHVAPSQAIADMLIHRYHVPDDRITTIHHGIEVSTFSTDAHLWDHAMPQILMFGRLSLEKGFDIGIHALARCLKQNWQLTIVGDGNEKESLVQLVEDYDMEDRVTFQPFTKNIPNVLKQHDIVLFPSRWEGLSLAVMEALTAGCLVLASNTGGIPELITHDKTGYLLPVEDTIAWAQQITHVLNTKGVQQDIVTAAAAYALDHFSIQRMRDAYTTLYQSMI